jgi:hypothetical protein
LDEWVPVLPPAYAAARARHARYRALAYELARHEAIHEGLCGIELRITDIDENALAVWQATWSGVHPSGAGSWDWRRLVDNIPRRAAVLPAAIWYGDDLCGLVLGQASRQRLVGDRHTITVTYAERRPEPPHVPLRGHVIAIAVAVARSYGILVGARRLRLRAPDRNLVPYYRRHGFEPVWKGSMPLHCEKEIRP